MKKDIKDIVIGVLLFIIIVIILVLIFGFSIIFWM